MHEKNLKVGTPLLVRGIQRLGFLEEAFGGLVRQGYASADELKRRLKVRSRLRMYETKIWKYIDDARQEARH